MKEELDTEGLKNWIMETKRYSPHSARDVLSRLKRLDKLLSFSDFLTLEKCAYYLVEIERTTEFNALSISVKSQMRKAWRFYCEYKSGLSQI